jgi:hypothetical protein
VAPGPFVLDGEHRQRESNHQKAGPGCHQQHHANSQDHHAHHGDGDPAEQPDQVVHIRKLANAWGTIAIGGDILWDSAPHVIGFIAVFLASTGAGLTLIIITAVRRSSAGRLAA